MPMERLARFSLLPELKLTKMYSEDSRYCVFEADKESEFEVCPKCASPARTVYDHRIVTVKDAPLRDKCVRLRIRKRRFWCAPCRKPFTEPIGGISKGKRHTARYQREILFRCENYSDLKSVRRTLDCSAGFLYKALYEELRLKAKQRKYPWPSRIGIDEHSFRRNPEYGFTEFVSFIIDQKNKRAFDAVLGRSVSDLEAALAHIPGKANVELVTMDLSETYRQFVKRNFANARIIADKFHVVKLLNPVINKKRKEITGDKRKLPVRKLLLKNSENISWELRCLIYDWLSHYPELRELYQVKQALHRLYRCKGYDRAFRSLKNLIDRTAASNVPEIRTLRKTLRSWFFEILAYFHNRITNARVEGYNNIAKVIKRRAYGYRSFENYRLRLLNACA